MHKTITRREVGKALAITGAAALVSPAALASDPDADLIELERQWLHILDVELPPIAEESERADHFVRDAAPYVKDPGETLAEIDADEKDYRAFLEQDTEAARASRELLDRDGDREGCLKDFFDHRRDRARAYAEYREKRARAEDACGYKEAGARFGDVCKRADATLDRIMAAKPETASGLAVQLRTINRHVNVEGFEADGDWHQNVADNASRIAGA